MNFAANKVMGDMALATVDDLVRPPRYAPRWGWHDDHATRDRTPAYLPALQQVRAEFAVFLSVLVEHGIFSLRGGPSRCLQLGMGECRASHDAWRLLLGSAVTVSLGTSAVDGVDHPSFNTHDPDALRLATAHAPYDLLFIDAGHEAFDVALDHADYGRLVRPGGIVAFHDALARPGFEEVEVHRYLATIPNVRMIGVEVGIAWIAR